MERAAWTDERLDDLSESIRSGFDRTDRDMRDLRSEMTTMRSDLIAQIEGVRETMTRVFVTMVVGFLSVLATILVRM